MRALIIDDNYYSCDLLGMALERAGYAVQTETSSLKGSLLLESSEYDLLVLDLLMPEPSGEMILSMFANGKLPRPRYVMIVTANLMVTAREVLAQADAIMDKPVNIGEFIEAVTQIYEILKTA